MLYAALRQIPLQIEVLTAKLPRTVLVDAVQTPGVQPVRVALVPRPVVGRDTEPPAAEFLRERQRTQAETSPVRLILIYVDVVAGFERRPAHPVVRILGAIGDEHGVVEVDAIG